MKTNKLEAHLLERLSRDSVMSYMYIIERFRRRYPNNVRFKLSEIEEHFKSVKKQSPAYRKLNLSAIKAYYDYLLDAGRIKEHPCRTYQIGAKRESGKNFSAHLTMEEMELIFKVLTVRYSFLENRDKVIVGLMIYQGITRKELVTMKLKDIDLDSGVVKIRGSKKLSKRVLALKPSQITAVMRYIDHERPLLNQSNSNVLVLSKLGMPLTTDAVHGFFSKFRDAIAKDTSPTNIRNSVIAHWLNVKKFPLEDVQAMAGHKYPSSTEKYKRPDLKQQRDAISQLHNSIFS